MKEKEKKIENEPLLSSWELVDWDLDFETFEWFLHLCEVNNRHLAGNQWVIWPDWPSDMPEEVKKEHRQSWLNLLQFIHEREQISVCQNLIRIDGNHGSVFFLEFLGVTIGWGNISLSENPPAPPDSHFPDPPPPAPTTWTLILFTSLGLYHVPFDVHTCMDLNPAPPLPPPDISDDQIRFVPLVLRNCPD